MQTHRTNPTAWRRWTAVLGLVFCFGPRVAVSQPALLPAPCDSEERRAFDFLLGTWRVESSAGVDGGTVRVTRRVDGCGLLEEWSNPSGRRGVSLNTYSPGDGSWHQTYVDNTGTVFHLAGGAVNNGMVLFDRSGLADGRVDRFGWHPGPDGTVRQTWHRTLGNGPWEAVYGATWSPVTASGGDPNPDLQEALQPLAELVGSWEMQAIDQDPQGNWVERTRTVAEIEPTLGGKFLRESAELDVAAGRLEYVMLLGHDPFQKIYRMSWNDSLAGLADVYEGTIEDGVLVLDNLRSETFWGSRDGTKSWAFRLEFDLEVENGTREMRVHTSDDRGATWSLTQRTIYTRTQ